MKTIHLFKYSLFLGLLLLTSISFASTPEEGKYKKTKTISKEFTVGNDNTVDIENKYGDITITTWNENTVSIEVVITVKSSDEEIANKRFNNINIAFNQEGNRVLAKTIINKNKNKWSFFKGNISIDTQIDYHIKMPVNNHVDLNNDYGSIFIDALDGKCKINCDYGSLRIGELNNRTNNIYLDYGSSSTIEYINSGKINTDYSTLSIDKANSLELVADYTNLEIEEVEYLKYTNDYGSLKINRVQVLEGDGDYLTLKVFELDEQMTVSCDYGSIKVYQINRSFNKVYIDADYTGVKLGIENAASFNFDLSTSYADIRFDDLDVNFSFKEVKMFSKTFKGSVSKENSDSFIKVNSSYSNIKLYQADE
ncbi:MAG TPA: hypothetical protein EYG92_06060 [Lutibacter sp.]|nr:hypothetical protein [Lutibacter sp.]